MLTPIKHKYADAEQCAKPVVLKPILQRSFMQHVREGVEDLFTRTNVVRNNHRMFANVLEHYLKHYRIETITPDECFLKDMIDRVKEQNVFNGKEYRWLTRKKIPGFTREVLNQYFYPKKLIKRKIVAELVRKRYEKFFSLSKKSRDAIVWFETHGKRVEAMPVYVEGKGNGVIKTMHRATNRPLLPNTKSGKIDHALRFLSDVKKKGFEEATDSDVKKFEQCCKKRGVVQTQDYLAHVASFFINIHSEGFIKHNPFAYTSLQMSGGAVKEEFIAAEDMEKIRDLSTLNLKNKEEVRDRLAALLAYDLALRISEFLSLEIPDIRKDTKGEWYVYLRKEIQKGHKDDEVMYFFFDETKELLELYLKKIRKQFNPVSDFLIVSGRGTALCAQQYNRRFKALCNRFQIKTYYGKEPSPHVLRHSFATLNISTIGLCIPIYEMAQRLRHARVETTRKNYIHNNPYLKKLKHDVLRKNNKRKTAFDILNEIPLPDLEHWLSATLGLNGNLIKQIRERHSDILSKPKIDKLKGEDRIYITEEDAINRVRHLEIPPVALRKYALKQDALKGDATCKYGKDFQYEKNLIDDLAQNWVPAESLRKKLNMKIKSFSRTLQREGWRQIKVGHVRYVHKLDCV